MPHVMIRLHKKNLHQEMKYSPSSLELKKCAALGLPKMILFAVGLQFVFTLILVTELHDHHQRIDHVLKPPNGFAHDERAAFQGSSNKGQANPFVGGDFNLDDTYRLHLMNMSQELKFKLQATQVKSCRWRVDEYTDYSENCTYHLERALSEGREGSIVIYNPFHHERFLCDGTKIGATSILYLNEEPSCSEGPKLFPIVPTLENSHEMNPIELSFGESGPLPDFPCDVPCKSAPGGRTVAKRIIHGTPWSLQFSMEGPQYYPSLRLNRESHNMGKFYSTTSFQSEIPLPYFSWDEYGYRIQAEAVKFDEAIKGAVFMANNCNSCNNREGLVKKLIDSSFRIDSVSRCLNNAPKPNNTNNDKILIMRHFLFYLAFENQCEDDYITEKLWQTFAAGVVPVYYGAPNIKEHIPPHSVIDVNDFNNTDDLADYLTKVAKNRTLYESYHKWRTKPLPGAFVDKYNFTHIHSTCRTCRWAFSKKYGLGWNHTTQSIQELNIPRKLCHEKSGLITHPFQESWLAANSDGFVLKASEGDQSTSTCETQDLSLSMVLQLQDGSKLRRTVEQKDGVTDILLGREEGSKTENITLQLTTKIGVDESSGSLRAFSNKYFQFQDTKSRMTILSDRIIDIVNEEIGVLELTMSLEDIPIHIRVIVEDINSFYDDAAERTSFFGKFMAGDFFNPLEKFMVLGSAIGRSDYKVWDEITLTNTELIEGADPEKEKANQRASKDASFKMNGDIAETRSLIHIGTPNDAEKMGTLAAIKRLIASGVINVHREQD